MSERLQGVLAVWPEKFQQANLREGDLGAEVFEGFDRWRGSVDFSTVSHRFSGSSICRPSHFEKETGGGLEGNRASVKSGPQREKTKEETKTKTKTFSAKECTYRVRVRDLAEVMFAFREGRPHSIRALQKCFSGCLFCSLASNTFQHRQEGIVLISKNSLDTTPPAASGDICH